MKSLSPTRRCPEHDLAAGPDGRCALCKRPVQSVPQLTAAAAPRAAWIAGAIDPLRWLLAVGLLLSVAGFALALEPLRVLATDMFAQASSAQTTAAAESTLKPQLTAAEPAAKNLSDARDSLTKQLGELSQAAKRVHDDAHDAQDLQNVEAARNAAIDEPLVQAVPPEAAPQPPSVTADAAEQDRKRHAAVEEQLRQRALQGARRDVQITMYSTSWCGACAKARAYMRDKQIPFDDHDVEQDAEARARAHTLNPGHSVPTITIDDQLLVGFSPDALESRIDRAARGRARL